MKRKRSDIHNNLYCREEIKTSGTKRTKQERNETSKKNRPIEKAPLPNQFNGDFVQIIPVAAELVNHQ